jgi:RimJ/RimL family protein N-acetyltransferase
MYPVEVTGPRGRVRLREFRVDDGAALHLVYGDPVATRYLSFEPRSREDVDRIVGRIVEGARGLPREEYSMAVERLPPGSAGLVGVARLAVGDHRSGQIGFALRPDCWHQGLGTEAVEALLTLAFQRLGLHRVWGARSPTNEGSARVMTRLGMREEGRIRHHVFVRGAWRDSVVHSILEDEWTALRAS